MSHLNACVPVISELDILRKAATEFGGLIWNEGARTYNGKKTFRSYYCHENSPDAGRVLDEQIKALGVLEHSITITGCNYEIGVVRKKDGSGYTLAFDSHDGSAARIVGDRCEKLVTAYTETLFREEYARAGFMLERHVEDDGSIVLVATDPTP